MIGHEYSAEKRNLLTGGNVSLILLGYVLVNVIELYQTMKFILHSVGAMILGLSYLSSNALAQQTNTQIAKKSCSAGRITCEQWCNKYRGGSSSCLRDHEHSCVRKHGGLQVCVADAPPG